MNHETRFQDTHTNREETEQERDIGKEVKIIKELKSHNFLFIPGEICTLEDSC